MRNFGVFPIRSGRRGRGFKSRHLDQNKIAVTLGFMRGCGDFSFLAPSKKERKITYVFEKTKVQTKVQKAAFVARFFGAKAKNHVSCSE